jgi:hypothetical protein
MATADLVAGVAVMVMASPAFLSDIRHLNEMGYRLFTAVLDHTAVVWS